MANSFPTALNNYVTGASSATLFSAGHAAEHNALEAKIGIDNSAVATSLDYLIKNTASIDPGHHHTNTSIDSLASSKLTGQVAVANGGTGAATLTGIIKGNGTSAFTAVTAPAGTIVGDTDIQTLTNKTLTTPIVNSGQIIQQIVTPANPSAGYDKIYTKNDDNLYVLTSAGVESKVGGGILTTAQYGPGAFLINGQIVTSIATNNLTVAIKGMNGSDPSAANPVYIRIGNTTYTLTAALSITLNSGTNWFNAGAAELATQEIDYFVYLGYNATDGITLGICRMPTIRTYGDFNITSTNEKYGAVSTITHAASTDVYELVGRFNAILSAGAAYTWSIPATSIIINHPIYETRILSYSPQWKTGGTAASLGNGTLSGKYKIMPYIVWMKLELFCGSTTTFGTSIYYMTFPFSVPADSRRDIGNAWFLNGGTPRIGLSLFNYTNSIGLEFISISNASVSQTSPATWASGDRLNANCYYEWA